MENPGFSARQFALTALLAATASVAVPPAAAAQYFGRNKVQYGSFDFEVLKTDHFDVYHYPAERTLKDFTPFASLGNADKEVASKAKVEALLKEKKATLWIQHDIIAYAKSKKSPAFYD